MGTTTAAVPGGEELKSLDDDSDGKHGLKFDAGRTTNTTKESAHA